MPNYKSKISVLHVEDDKKTLKELASELMKRNIYVHSVTNLEDAVNAIKKCEIEILVCDGMFPAKKGQKEEKNFIPLIEKIKKLEKKIAVIAWSNSTHVHEYCKKNKMESYSKELITKERFKLRKRKYIKVRKLDVHKMADIVEKKILDKTCLDKIRNIRFEEYYSEPGTVLAMFMAVDMRTAMFKETAGMNYGPWLTEIENGLCTVYADKSNDAIVSNSIYQKIIKHNFFPEIDRNVNVRAKKLLYFSRSLKSMNYSRHSNKVLQALYLKFCRLFMEMRMYSSLPTAMEHGTSSWTYLLKNILKNKIDDEQELNRIFSILTTPRKLSYMKEFELETAKTGIRKHQRKNVKTEVKQLAEKYAWINYTFEGIPIDEKYILDKLADLGKSKHDFEAVIKENDVRQKEVEKEKQSIIKKYRLSEKEKTLFEIGADIVFIKFFRKGVFAESYYNVEFLLEEIGKRIGCTRKQVANMLPYEVLAALELSSFPGSLIDNRIKKSAMLHYAGCSYALPKSAESIYKKSIITSIRKETNELKGQTAFPGKVSGKVKIINVIKDMEKFRQGDILVSRSTNPTLVPAMKKAAAIVTDLGGLTCHAAIVAREMNKPCIIGTKIATKIFKDGDYVEVDANKGIVRKIKKTEKPAKEPEWTKIVVMKIDAISAYMECFAYAKYHKKVFGVEFKPKVKYEDGDLLNSKEDIEKLRDFFRKDLKRVEKTIKTIKKECKSFVGYCKKLSKEKVSKEKLKEFFDKFARAYTTFGSPVEMGFVMEERLKPLLEQHNLRFSDISVPCGISETAKNEMEMAKLKSRKETDRFLKDNGWMATCMFLGEPLNKNHLTKEKHKAHEVISKIKNDRLEMEEKIKYLDNEEKELIRIFQDLIFIRTHRMENINKAIYYSRPFLYKLAKKIGVKYEELIYMSPPEIIESFDKKPAIKEMRKRIEGFYATNIPEFSIKPMKKKIDVKEGIKEISGVVANPGKVVGKVRKITDAKDITKIKIGEIMVTEMTTPDFVVGMKKVGAIITDLGGMTSHTAVVSRELDIPAIIGTDNATKIFKDGDCVFVDAEKGIVRKLTKDEYNGMKQLILKEKKIERREEAIIEKEIAEAPKRPDIALWFKDVFKEDLPIVGGKGANLGEMFGRFPIPNGFCITVNAYQQFLNENRLDKKIFPLLSNLDAEDTRKLDSVSKKIENLILKARMSKAVEKEALANYRKMKNFVAVRSSATAEDLPTASFAGQQATFLNVKGEKEFLDVVKRCWASLFTSRAIYYRNTNSFDHEKVLISVVVQEMVDSEKAGVMFTVNPVTKNPEEMIIEGSFGLGEMVVSGQVTPDSYIVNKNSMKLTMKNIGDKKLAMIRKDGKNIIKNLSEKESGKQVLTENEVRELANLGKAIEQHYGKPQDIEWAVYKGKIYILQSRPITTL